MSDPKFGLKSDLQLDEMNEALERLKQERKHYEGAGKSNSSNQDYWEKQSAAVARIRQTHDKWARSKTRAAFKTRRQNEAKSSQGWKRETFCLPRLEAQEKARAYLKKFPKAAYWSEVESWRQLPDDVIEFTMRRLPTAD